MAVGFVLITTETGKETQAAVELAQDRILDHGARPGRCARSA